MIAEGSALEELLERLHIVQGSPNGEDWNVNMEALLNYFDYHCVVFRGEMARKYWPLYRS